MRLSTNELEGIIKAFKTFISEYEAHLYLFGSRAKDSERGGDIDLLVIIKNEDILPGLKKQKPVILNEIKKSIGDQKIDLLLESESSINDNPFLQSTLSHATLIKKWG